jgi:hypothetical protein
MKYNISFKGELNVDDVKSETKDEKQFKETISKVNLNDLNVAKMVGDIINNLSKEGNKK